MKELKSTFVVASIYITTIIGAGFASGQEIMTFFSAYHTGGFWGILFAGTLFACIGCIVLGKVYTERIKSYEELLFPMTGWFIGWVVEIGVAIFLLILFVVMIAGGGTIFYEKLNMPFQAGVLFMLLTCMAVLFFDIKALVAVNVYSGPILTIGLILTGMYVIIVKDTDVFSVSTFIRDFTHNWFFSSLLYVSYNSLMSIVVMASLLPYLKSKRSALLGGIVGGISLSIVAVLLNVSIDTFYPDIFAEEIPVLVIVEKYSGSVGTLYSLILWMAMFSSAVNAGYCFINRVHMRTGLSRKAFILILSMIALPMASVGFSNLIANIYPLFGYIGMFLVFVILFEGIKSLFASRTSSLREFRQKS